MNDAEFIADRVAALEESVRYFSSANKAERERWVVEALLENLNIPFSSSDVISPEKDPPDVVALGAEFEVKEILDPGRRRHQEYKEELDRARAITDPQDLLTGFTPKDSSVGEIFQRCSAEIEKLKIKYPAAVRKNLDLLFYVNFEHVFRVREEPFPDVAILEACGWRSVTFVKGQIACCFFADTNAPKWLQQTVGKVQHKVWE